MSMPPRRLPMEVRVDEERCQGHGLCRLSAPAIFFAREEDGHAYVKSETVPAGQEDDAQLAADSCPELAIEVE
jgi:ferredoxin